MSLTLQPAPPRRVKNAVSHGIFTPKGVKRLLHLTFVSGPWLLLTSRLSTKNASLMIMLCAPALLLCALLTIPPLLFPSPQQQAYFYFAQMLNQDPTRWVILAAAAVCAFIALALPATQPESTVAIRY